VRILVTGGAGFIGSHVVRELTAAGHEVVVVDALLPLAHEGVQPDLEPGVEHRWGDLADPVIARDVVAGVDAVSHQASMVGLGADFADVGAYVHHNDAATASLLGALHERGFAGRLVLAASMVVYGEGRYRCPVHGVQRPGPRPEAQLDAGRWDPECTACGAALVPKPVTEDSPVDPRSVYAATKLHQEHLAACFGREHGVPVTALRYHNVYGPGMPRDTPYAGVASIFRSALERGDAPTVFEDGRQLRDFVHVHDVARANRLALEAARPVDGPVNVASGEPRTVFELADALSRAQGAGAPRPEIRPQYRLGDVRHVFASTARIRERLGFAPEVSFADGIDEFVAAPLRG
jgi:dTDP-L-rhamnose 4-epimerase